MEKKYKILALFGKSGAGKDTIQRWLIKTLHLHGIVSCTTRSPRSYEKDGIDYFFLTNEEFTYKVLNGTMLEATEFNGWFYGTPIQALDKDKVNVGVFNIEGIRCLLEDSRLDVLPVYIDAYDYVRLKRCLERERHPDCIEICRRFLADEKDFSNIDFKYIMYLNMDEDKGYFNIQNIPEINDFINGQE